jgi:D-mannonate dehydratase
MLRYSPILTNAGLTLSNIFSKPEKIQLNRANERVGAGKLGNYMKYNPMDFEYLANKIKQQGASTRRAISNNSAGNRATATAGILASDYNLNNALGDTYTKVQDLNNQRRNVVEEFNRGTNMFNIQNDMQAQLANQRNTLLNTEIANKETLLNSQANANRRNSIREGIATVGTQLGQLGTENR